MEHLKTIIKNTPNDRELGELIRANRDLIDDSNVNLTLEIYPNDEDLGFFLRNLILYN